MKKCIPQLALTALTLAVLSPMALAAPPKTGKFTGGSSAFNRTTFSTTNFNTGFHKKPFSSFNGGFKPGVIVNNRIDIDINIFVNKFGGRRNGVFGGTGFGGGKGFVGGAGFVGPRPNFVTGGVRSAGFGNGSNFGGTTGEGAYFGFMETGVSALRAGQFSSAVKAFNGALGVRPGDGNALQGKKLALASLTP